MVKKVSKGKGLDKYNSLCAQYSAYVSVYNDAIQDGERQKGFALIDQWTDSSRLEAQDRSITPLTRNEIIQNYIHGIGYFEDIRPGLKVGVSGDVDIKVAAIFQEEIDKILVAPSTNSVFKSSFADSLKTGCASAILVTNEYINNPFNQEISFKFIDYKSVYFDPSAKLPTKSDGLYVGYTFVMTRKMLDEVYNIKADDIVSDFSSQELTYNSQIHETVTLAHHFEKTTTIRKFTTVETPRGDNEIVEYEDFIKEQEILPDFEQSIIIGEIYDVTFTVITEYILSGNDILHERELDIPEFPLVVVDGIYEEWEGSLYPRSFGYYAIDIQQSLNIMESAISTQAASIPLTQMIVNKNAIPDKGSGKDSWSDPNNASLLLTNGDPARDVQFFPKRGVDQTLVMKAETNRRAIQSLMGVTAAGRGEEDRELSGRAMHAKIFQGNHIFDYYVQSFRYALNQIGNVLVYIVPSISNKEELEDVNPINLHITITEAPPLEAQRQDFITTLNVMASQVDQQERSIIQYSMLSEMGENGLLNASKLRDTLLKHKRITDPITAALIEGIDPAEIDTQQPDPAMVQAQQEFQLKQMELQNQAAKIEVDRLEIQAKMQANENTSNKIKADLITEQQRMDLAREESARDTQRTVIKANAEVTKSENEIIKTTEEGRQDIHNALIKEFTNEG